MLPYPQIDPIIFRIGPFAPRWYGMVYLLGFLYTYFVMRKYWRWLGLKTKEQVDGLLFGLIFSMLIGSRFTYVVVYNFDTYVHGPWWKAFAVWEGGLSLHGGVWGVMLGSLIVCRLYRVPILRAWDVLMLTTPLALGFGRIANFINGELWGRVTDVPWAMVFPMAGPEPRHPSQLYEAFFEGFLLFAVVRYLWSRRVPQGVIAGTFAIWYAVVRSWLEMYREPDRQLGFLWGGFTMGQILSVVLFLMGVATVIWGFRHKQSPEEAEALANRELWAKEEKRQAKAAKNDEPQETKSKKKSAKKRKGKGGKKRK